MTAGSIYAYRAGAGAARAVQDTAGLVLLPGRLEMPAAGRGTGGGGTPAVPSNDTAVSGDRVAVVLVDAVGRVALLSRLVLHLAQVMRWSYLRKSGVFCLSWLAH
jgi:hypothetical protein